MPSVVSVPRSSGVFPSIGRRDAYRPTVWIDDAAAAVAAALNAPVGTYNVADADPPTRGEIEAALAEVVGRGGLRSPIEQIPPALEPVARSQRVSSRRLRRRRAGIHACAGARRAGA